MYSFSRLDVVLQLISNWILILHGWLLHGCVNWAEDCYDWWLPCLALWLEHWYQKPWAWSPDFYCIHICLLQIFFIQVYLFRIEFRTAVTWPGCSFHKLLHVWFLFSSTLDEWDETFGRNCNVLTIVFWSGKMEWEIWF